MKTLNASGTKKGGAYSELKTFSKGVFKTERIGDIIIGRKSIEKTQNVNKGKFIIDALMQLKKGSEVNGFGRSVTRIGIAIK